MKFLLQGSLLVCKSFQIGAEPLFLLCALGANLLKRLARMLSGPICFPCLLATMGINKCPEVRLTDLRSRELTTKPNEFLGESIVLFLSYSDLPGESGNLSPSYLVLLLADHKLLLQRCNLFTTKNRHDILSPQSM